MLIEPFRHNDIDSFLMLAAEEGWICDRWECEFLLEQFPAGCLVAREEGLTVGFVTSIRYGESGWIGNLITRKTFRGKGIGSLLMEEAVTALTDAGAETVWLTASKLGRPIYERLGFTVVDVINRWVGKGLWKRSAGLISASRSEVMEIDYAGWGDRREALVEVTAERGRLFCAAGAFLISQPCGDGIQIGPWGGVGSAASLLLDEALLEAGKGARIVLDVPIRNTGQTALLLGKGFSIQGSTLLMCRGKARGYAPEYVCALASLGSMG
ncbi:MAG TPA: GNAT family N-acetyltransferase [Geobacteraceae bacterium]|nr:GNAT family N-acetyltransferase [Geobacteraceae bacterium]